MDCHSFCLYDVRACEWNSYGGINSYRIIFCFTKAVFGSHSYCHSYSPIVFNIDYLPLERARNSLMAFITLDKQAVMNADGSAAARIIPVVNTLTKLDLSSWEGWLGHGVDYGLSKWIFSDRVMLGGIADYGFLSFIVMQIAVYTCMIRKFFSLETLLWMFWV